jgi:hypothetical protein
MTWFGQPEKLKRLDVLGTRPFFALAFRVRDPLAFMQVVETAILDARRMKEEVFVAACLDESETLVRQFFDRAFGHVCVPLF